MSADAVPEAGMPWDNSWAHHFRACGRSTKPVAIEKSHPAGHSESNKCRAQHGRAGPSPARSANAQSSASAQALLQFTAAHLLWEEITVQFIILCAEVLLTVQRWQLWPSLAVVWTAPAAGFCDTRAVTWPFCDFLVGALKERFNGPS